MLASGAEARAPSQHPISYQADVVAVRAADGCTDLSGRVELQERDVRVSTDAATVCPRAGAAEGGEGLQMAAKSIASDGAGCFELAGEAEVQSREFSLRADALTVCSTSPASQPAR